MVKRKSNVKIEDSKVIFSKEILDYFESLRTEENSKWIDKYFEVLSDTFNLTAEKYNIHHIRPCCTFKDEIHKNRKETEKLADEFNENRIKLSYKNHIIAHYFLWKIFPNDKDCRCSVYTMLGELNFENLTENEIIKFSKIQEDCKKANQTEEEIKEYFKNYRKTENRKINYRKYQLSEKGKMKGKEWQQSEKGKQSHKLANMKYNSKKCIDPITNTECSLNALYNRKFKHKNLYINIKPSDCIIK